MDIIGAACWPHQKARRHNTKQKSTNMGEMSNASCVNPRNRTYIQTLHQEPEAYQKCCSNDCVAYEDQIYYDGPDAVAWLGDQNSSHLVGNRAARAKTRNPRERIT